jgi:hypothetical protein
MRTEVSHRVKEDRNVIHTMSRSKASWTGHMLLIDCLLKQVIEENIETTEEEEDISSYWMTLRKREEALDPCLWRTRLERFYGSVVRQTTE